MARSARDPDQEGAERQRKRQRTRSSRERHGPEQEYLIGQRDNPPSNASSVTKGMPRMGRLTGRVIEDGAFSNASGS
jgi:hypothetical protein